LCVDAWTVIHGLRIPFKVPDHVWDVFVKHKSEFPNTWEDGEPYPYSVSWME